MQPVRNGDPYFPAPTVSPLGSHGSRRAHLPRNPSSFPVHLSSAAGPRRRALAVASVARCPLINSSLVSPPNFVRGARRNGYRIGGPVHLASLLPRSRCRNRNDTKPSGNSQRSTRRTQVTKRSSRTRRDLGHDTTGSRARQRHRLTPGSVKNWRYARFSFDLLQHDRPTYSRQ